MAWDIIKLVLYFIVFCVILWGAYATSKWLAGRNPIGGYSSKYMRVLDRIQVTKDSYVCIVQVGEKYFLAGISSGNVNLLSQLSGDDLIEIQNTEFTNPMQDIVTLLSGLMNKNTKRQVELDEFELEEKDEMEHYYKEIYGSEYNCSKYNKSKEYKNDKIPLDAEKTINKSKQKTDKVRKRR